MTRGAKGGKMDPGSVEELPKSQPAGSEASRRGENAPSTGQAQPQPDAQPQAAESDGNLVASGGGGAGMPITEMNGTLMRIKAELNEITRNPPPNCSAEMYKGDLYHWRATILGPIGTVYEGGVFKLDVRFPYVYPFRPPHIRFITYIYHCNVDSRGIICLDGLNERWSPDMSIAKMLLSIWVLIGECNPNDPLVTCIAEQYKTDRAEHDRVARSWTKRFAMPRTQDGSTEEGLEQEAWLEAKSGGGLACLVEWEPDPPSGCDTSS